ncbi:transposase, partial [Escherichia coli]|uniref:transposase n=1 Tax=Escherichia coli TaxID=562 RepID=UPI001F13E90B
MIDVLGPEKRRRRTTQEKIAIVQQSFEPGMTVSLVARQLNRPGFPGECFICELRLPDHYFRWKHNKLFLLLPEE